MTITKIKHVRCGSNQDVFEACRENFEPGARVVINGMGVPHPFAVGMIGTITVRRGEAYAVVPCREVPITSE